VVHGRHQKVGGKTLSGGGGGFAGPATTEVGTATAPVTGVDPTDTAVTGRLTAAPTATIAVPVITEPSGALRLTNEYTTAAGIRHPSNTGPCPITLNGIRANGNLLNGALELLPGQSASWYTAPAAAVAIVVGAWDCPSGGALLTYDIPLA